MKENITCFSAFVVPLDGSKVGRKSHPGDTRVKRSGEPSSSRWRGAHPVEFGTHYSVEQTIPLKPELHLKGAEAIAELPQPRPQRHLCKTGSWGSLTRNGPRSWGQPQSIACLPEQAANRLITERYGNRG